ncbi:MAG TPA: serpin family protein [Blastocatellia bacterium]|nr:serpin family protein [Blastocatellia bacterium]
MIARLSTINRLMRAAAVALLLALLGCTGVIHSDAANNNSAAPVAANTNEPAMENQQPTAGGKLDPRLAAANLKFGFKLYSELSRQSAEKNIFVSPASVAICLAMAYNGAAAETRQAMARALETQALSLDELNRAYADLRAALENPDAKVRLQIANSLWARQGLQFKPDFIRRNKDYFGAQVTALDFGDPASAGTINRWVSDKTNGKIDKIIDQIDANSVLFLINAIYFKGAWAREFDKAKTHEEDFTLARGNKRVPMMSQSGNYQYLETKDFQAVGLPYSGGRVSFYVFLPAPSSSLAAFEKGLTEANWQAWMEQFSAADGDVSLPRFRVTYEVALNDALKALGMGVAFDEGRANFSEMIQMGGRNVYISRVKHKTFAEVNEEGTEAAAVTSTEMRATSARREVQRFRMVVDRPFFCAIRDNASGAVLFMGSIYDPQ